MNSLETERATVKRIDLTKEEAREFRKDKSILWDKIVAGIARKAGGSELSQFG